MIYRKRVKIAFLQQLPDDYIDNTRKTICFVQLLTLDKVIQRHCPRRHK